MSRRLRVFVLMALVAGGALQIGERGLCGPWGITAAVRVLAQGQPGQTPAAEMLRARYTKYEYTIPMRDGVKLFTAVYVPKDAASSASQAYPIMLNRTPYSVAPYGVDFYRPSLGPSDLFSREGFIFAYQDVRGRFMSEGEWVEMRPHLDVKRGPKDIDESTDTYDTIDWLLKHIPNNNGRVGLWGISYPGFYAAAGMIEAHPALKAVSPQAPIADLFMGDDAYHNGAFMLAANFGFYTGFFPRPGGPQPREDSGRFDYGTPDGYDFYLRLGPLSNSLRYMQSASGSSGSGGSNAKGSGGSEGKSGGGKSGGDGGGTGNPYWAANLDHTTYDAFWKARALTPHIKDIMPAMMAVGGWFDAEDLAGPLAIYRQAEKTSHGRQNMLVMGPWAHGGWSRDSGDRLGNLDFALASSQYYREKIEYPFFMQHLKDKPGGDALPEAYVFETGTNQWRQHDSWPPKEAQPLTFYFSAGGALAAEAPRDDEFDEYVSDPNRPVPFVGYTTQGMTRDYMTEDQRFAATRPDVLVYETELLDTDVTIVGPIKVDLQVSTSGTDSDFVVKLIDVYPGMYPAPAAAPGTGGGAGAAAGTPAANAVKFGSYQQLVRGEPFRGKFRNSFEKPEPFTPNQPARIAFDMPDVYHTFRKGHRIMVHVQSSWFPLVDRNPQKFVEIPKATAADFQKATQRIYRSSARPSSVSVLTLGARPAAVSPRTSP